MRLPSLIQQRELLLTCRNCGQQLPVAFTVRSRPGVTRGEIHVSVTVDPVAAVMARLYADAHQGPFEKRHP